MPANSNRKGQSPSGRELGQKSQPRPEHRSAKLCSLPSCQGFRSGRALKLSVDVVKVVEIESSIFYIQMSTRQKGLPESQGEEARIFS